jgi:hypothetical protein
MNLRLTACCAASVGQASELSSVGRQIRDTRVVGVQRVGRLEENGQSL